MAQGMQGVTSGGLGSLVKPAITAATKTAQADKVKAVKVKVGVKIKKKLVASDYRRILQIPGQAGAGEEDKCHSH